MEKVEMPENEEQQQRVVIHRLVANGQEVVAEQICGPQDAYAIGTEESLGKEDQLTASEALYAFCGWLTSRQQKTVMSIRHDAAVVADLIKEFCDVNELEDPQPGWENKLRKANTEQE